MQNENLKNQANVWRDIRRGREEEILVVGGKQNIEKKLQVRKSVFRDSKKRYFLPPSINRNENKLWIGKIGCCNFFALFQEEEERDEREEEEADLVAVILFSLIRSSFNFLSP